MVYSTDSFQRRHLFAQFISKRRSTSTTLSPCDPARSIKKSGPQICVLKPNLPKSAPAHPSCARFRLHARFRSRNTQFASQFVDTQVKDKGTKRTSRARQKEVE
jgi:hypothetical protein